MPVVLEKEIGEPGRFFTEKGVIDLTEGDFRGFIEAFQDMRQAGLEVPVPFAHPARTDEKGLPVAKRDEEKFNARDKDRLNAGWVQDLFVNDEGRLAAKLLVRDSDAEKLREIGGFVSPQFGPYKNPLTGTKYAKTITHLAITGRPVNPKQSKDFLLAQTAMSLDDAFADGPIEATTIQMADDGYNEPDSDDLYSDEDDPEAKPLAEGEKKPTPLQRVRECLRKHHNISLPDDWSPSSPNAIKTLLAAAESSAMAEQGKQQDTGERDAPGTDKKLRTEPTILVMSMDAQAKVAEAVKAGTISQEKADELLNLAKTLQLSLDAEIKPATPPPPAAPVQPTVQMSQPDPTVVAMQRRLTVLSVKDMHDRIDRALRSGRCTPHIADQLKAEAATFQFSADAETDPMVDAKLNLIEAMPVGVCWSDVQKTQQMAQGGKTPVVVEQQPGFMTGEEVQLPEDADKFVDDYLAGRLTMKSA